MKMTLPPLSKESEEIIKKLTLPTFRDVEVIHAVAEELHQARGQHGAFASAHEGYAVLLEEVRELESEVFKKRGERSQERLRNEAIQVAAMAAKFAADCAPRP